MKKRFFLFLLLGISLLYGQESPGCVFLMIYPGAREVGLAGAFSSIADNAFATYYNPAGLAFQKGVDFVYHKIDPWLPGLTGGLDIKMYYIYSAITFPTINKFNFGLFYDYLNTGETEVWNEKGRLIGTYETYDYALGISGSYKILNNWGIGGNIKYIYSFLVPEWVIERARPGKTFALDFGILYKNKIKNFLEINKAWVLKNLGPKIGYISSIEKDPLPYEIRIGYSLKFKFLSFLKLDINNWLIDWVREKTYLLLAYDLRQDLYFEGKPWNSFGFEFSLGPFFFNIGYFEDTDGWRGGVILEKYYCISLFEYIFDYIIFNREDIKSKYIQAPTWSFGLDFKFLRIEWGTDSNIYSFYPKRKIFSKEGYKANPRFTISLNLGTPFIK